MFENIYKTPPKTLNKYPSLQYPQLALQVPCNILEALIQRTKDTQL